MIRKGVVLILLSVWANGLFAGKVTIKGIDTNYAGESLSFYNVINPITGKEKELIRLRVDSSGKFHASFHIKQTKEIFAYPGILKARMYVIPNSEYTISLPAKIEKTEADKLNPYFEPKETYIDVIQKTNLDASQPENIKNELNHLIARFDEAFYNYYDDIAKNIIYSSYTMTRIDSIKSNLDDKFPDSGHSYFNIYKTYHYGLLKIAALKYAPEKLIDGYFANKAVHYYNPAYIKLFNHVYDKYFFRIKDCIDNKDLVDLINKDTLMGRINRCIKSSDKNTWQNDSLYALVMLKNFYDGFYNENIKNDNLLKLLDVFFKDLRNPAIKRFAREVRYAVTRLMPGFSAPGFELLNKDSILVSLEDFKGKYVYLNFCHLQSYTCLKHFGLLGDFAAYFKKHLQVVTILYADRFSDMADFLLLRDYNWPFLFVSPQSEVLDKYNVRVFPTYYLISPKGKMLRSPADPPDKEFDQYLIRLLEQNGLEIE